jgi:hypothetical protein
MEMDSVLRQRNLHVPEPTCDSHANQLLASTRSFSSTQEPCSILEDKYFLTKISPRKTVLRKGWTEKHALAARFDVERCVSIHPVLPVSRMFEISIAFTDIIRVLGFL